MTQPNWYTRGPGIAAGEGAPPESPPPGKTRIKGDLWLNTTTGDVSEWDGSWSVTGNIKGPPGAGAGDAELVTDTSPQLGGDLDLNGHKIGSATATDLAKLHDAGTLTGNNTGDQDLSGLVPTSRTVAGKPLSSNVTLAKSDVGLGSVDNTSDADKSVAYAAAAGGAGSAVSATSATKLATARKINGVDFDGTGDITIAVGGSGDVTGQSASVDGEVALFSGTSGKEVKRATVSGIPKMASGVLSAATEGTDYYKPTGTDVALADGGTGASDAAGARANLGVSKYLGPAANQSGMTALTGNVGDWCVRTDLDSVFVLTALPATTAGNWLQPDPDLPAKIHAATAKTSLVDGDEFAIVDSEAGNVLKRVGWDTLAGSLWDIGIFTNANWGTLVYFFQQEASLLVNVSSAAITLSANPGLNVFTGSTARTWTLPPVAGNTGKVVRIKNRASQTLTISRAGSDQIYAAAAGNTATVAAGASLTLVNDGTYWLTN